MRYRTATCRLDESVGEKNSGILLFDLGGVIVPWVGLEELQNLTGLDRDGVLAKLETLPEFEACQTGRCTDAAFLAAMTESFAPDMTPEDFADLWNSWVKPPYEGTKSILESLKDRYTLACLSNTNHLHWEYLKTRINLDELFDYTFASHHIHAAKPGPESFKIALERMEADAENVRFFDDTLENVTAAGRLGMTAFHVDRDVGVAPVLKQLDLI
ncbi:MAG: HAD family phosphatase [Hyphomonadaceae bacterium]|nr:HAD family phosphatase [Hyphomonadaceae bacterium]